MISAVFFETDSREAVRKAALLIHPDSPYRKCLEMVMAMAESGRAFEEVVSAVEDRWHAEYPATNNAVANGGIVAAAVWFGEGDVLKTVNLAARAADFTDADCNAANAASVIGAMRGMKALPQYLVEQFGDRIQGNRMGGIPLTPPVDESIPGLAQRTARIGAQIVIAEGGCASGEELAIPVQSAVTQPAELFRLADLLQYWNPDWKLERAGFGGGSGGLAGIHGMTFLKGDVLATFPRDEVRGALLRRTVRLSAAPRLSLQAGADAGRAWQLEIIADNEQLLKQVIEGAAGEGRTWKTIELDLLPFAGKEVILRIYQRVLFPDKVPGNAYWKNIQLR